MDRQCASSLLRDAFSQNARDPLCQLARDGNRVTNSGQTQSRAQRPFPLRLCSFPSVQNFFASIFLPEFLLSAFCFSRSNPCTSVVNPPLFPFVFGPFPPL